MTLRGEKRSTSAPPTIMNRARGMLCQRHDRAERQRAAGKLQDEPWQRDQIELVAQQGNASADPEQAKITDGEWMDWFLGSDGSSRHKQALHRR